ncbi:hypothetical protein GCM10023166_21900 [Paeniglutamicibacter cryotolerans]
MNPKAPPKAKAKNSPIRLRVPLSREDPPLPRDISRILKPNSSAIHAHNVSTTSDPPTLDTLALDVVSELGVR